MANRRDVAFAIGVGDAKPLPYLRGAVNGARAFHDWASKLRYDSKLLTDEENNPVTITRLRSELESMLKPPSLGSSNYPVHRLLLYFAGHGLIREIGEDLWLLSDWNEELRAVSAEGLKRRLYMHSIQQIAIFADCCKSLPANIAAADLTTDNVLGLGPIREQRPPAIDKFSAAQDGSATFMVPGINPEEDRCLFSGVLMEGLWGARKEAFSKRLKDQVVTSQSLGTYLNVEVPKLAERYKRKLFPIVSHSFPEDDDIYFGYFGDGPPPKPPIFPVWPPPDAVTAMEPRLDPGPIEDLDRTKQVSYRGGGIDSIPSASSLIERMRSQPRPNAFETGAGFAVEGGAIRALWTPTDVFAESRGQSNWWQVRQLQYPMLRESAPVLIEFEDGMLAATAAVPGFIATVLRDERGISALIYRPAYAPPDTAELAEFAIAKIESGALRADAATDLAVGLRQKKHVDPVLGVISAYLYDSIGDIDNIRRMAFYYVEQRQPIPYDIALLGLLRGDWRDGQLWAQVPAVKARKPRTEAERSNGWTHSATSATAGQVGGLWPWMRQGWKLLDDPADDESTLIRPGMIELIRHLAPGRFAMLDAEGGSALARLFGLSKGRPGPSRRRARAKLELQKKTKRS